MSERLADLDELVLRCRDKSTKEYIQEAVTCYRAAAFRSCIVSAWNAVVFDFIHKLRQLEQTGHKNAQQKLKEFEDIRSKQDISKMLAFERSVPDLAWKEFEFISPLEHSDLTRLLEDRNRCAHPSMQSLEETFQASAELARYHLRNAVMHLLQHPPVQGRAALDLIWTDIRSEYFPTEVEQAVTYFSSGPLIRARKPLIRGVIIGLTKSLLLEDLPKAERSRQFAALQAIVQMYFELTEETIKSELSKIAIQVSDAGLPKVITYLRYLKAWEYLDEACQTKAKSLIERVEFTASVPVLIDALNIVELQSIALERVKHLPAEIIIQNFQTELPPEYMQPVVKDHIQSKVEIFIQSSSSREAATNGRALLQVTKLLNAEQLEIILDAFCAKNQINEALGVPEIMQEIFNKTLYLTESVESVQVKWAFVRQLIDSEQFLGVTSITALKELIDLKFPNLDVLSATDGTGIKS
ncbi:MAG: hypothetical protein KME22_12465 [Hassallia sp. WJT32-NPBG1]|jgi:hypothetical protein|nr:hypothetical protein [Hassallia sp. WJT32-NPBG1]